MIDGTDLTVLGVSKFADRLDEAMKLSGKSAADLCKVLVGGDGTIGASPQAVYAALAGRTNSFSAENTARAAKYLGVDLYWLATGVGSATAKAAGALDPDQAYVCERMARMTRDQIETMVAIADAFTGPSGDRVSIGVSYAPRAGRPSSAPVSDRDTPAD